MLLTGNKGKMVELHVADNQVCWWWSAFRAHIYKAPKAKN